MRAQASSLPFTPIFASLVAVINTKLPEVGLLLCHRLISQFRRAYKRNDKPTCVATSTFIAHLVNQQVLTSVIALEIIVLLLEKVTDDSVEIAVGFIKEVGLFLSEDSPRTNMAIYTRLNEVLQGSEIQKRSQYMIEVLAEVRRDKFKDNPVIPEGLDLVEDDEKAVSSHTVSLQDEVSVQEGLSTCCVLVSARVGVSRDRPADIFKHDPDNYVKAEADYAEMKRAILGDEESDEDDSEGGSEDEDSDEDDVPDTGIGTL